MRIISGKYKKRKIITVDNLNTRPVTDRIKESIFNILAHRFFIADSYVLDLFAGSGSFGLEAISRKAAKAVFIESDSSAFNFLLENIKALGCDSICFPIRMDVISYINKCTEKFDFIFLDPPFKMNNSEKLVDMVKDKSLLKENGIIIFRNDSEVEFDEEKFKTIQNKKIGRSYIYFIK